MVITLREDLVEQATGLWENDRVYSCLLENDIYYIYHKDSTLAEVSDMKELTVRYRELYKSVGAMKVIAEMGPYSSMDKNAREYLQNQKEDAICEAVVLHGMAQRLLVNFYFQFTKHKYPSKAFKTFEKAHEWVSKF